MRFILRTCSGREHFVSYIRKHIPNLEICFDDRGGAMHNFIKSLEMSGEDAVVNMEDDIILTKNFCSKACAVINKKPESLIQFFSMRKADKTIGSRWENGSSYLMAQCTYLPEKMSKGLLAFSSKYDLINHKSHPLDSMVAEFLKASRQKYWIHCPSLVDHRVGVSMIDPRRAKTNRQSFTFINPEE